MLTIKDIEAEADKMAGNSNTIDNLANGWFVAGGCFVLKKSEAELAALRAENAKLREVLEKCFPRALKNDREEARVILNSTTPDPLYNAAPEMLEVLEIIYTNRPKTLRTEDLQDFSSWFCKAWEEDIANIIARAKGETA